MKMRVLLLSKKLVKCEDYSKKLRSIKRPCPDHQDSLALSICFTGRSESIHQIKLNLQLNVDVSSKDFVS